jgi:hypothetical protein
MLPLGRNSVKINVEHRTSNIERRILMALRFIDLETSESLPAMSSAKPNFEKLICFAQSFLNRQNSLFDVGSSTFDVNFLVYPFYETILPKFLLRLNWPLSNPTADLKPDTLI